MLKFKSSLRSSTVATMTCLAASEYTCPKWSRIYSVFCDINPVLSSFMTNRWICYNSNTTGAINGGRAAYPSGALEFPPVFLRVHS
jgi:hypothetical protein